MAQSVVLPVGSSILLVLVGIIVSLVLPVAVRTLQSARSSLESAGATTPTLIDRLKSAWTQYGGNRYLKIALASAFVAVVLVLLLGLEFSKARDAVLAGFAWDSLVSKLMGAAPAKTVAPV